MLKLYHDLAQWWPLLSPPEDYLNEADFFKQLFLEVGLPPNPTLLELGAGGGHNAFHLKELFTQVTLTDISPNMLAMSQTLNHQCEHIEGDMRMLRLGRTFDVVFIHDAIDYMITHQDLEQAMETAFIHCRAGGLALFIPDYVKETFLPVTDHGGTDSAERGIRYLEWSYDPDPTDTTYITQYVYLLREANQAIRTEHDEHTCGLFSRAEWLQLLSQVGFQVKIVHDSYNRDLFVASKLKD